MTHNNSDSSFGFFLSICLCFIVLFIKWCYDSFSNRIDAGLVIMNDPECSNFNNFREHRRWCQSQYCALKMMKKIEEKINSAESTIDIAMYNFTNQILVRCIKNACKRGVVVRLLIDKSMLTTRIDEGRIIELGLMSAIKLQEAGKFWWIHS